VSRVRLQDLKHQPLRIPAGWTVSYNSFYEVDPGSDTYIEGLPNGNAWGLSSQDLLQISNSHYDVLVDLGWVPDEDPNGSFVVQVIRETDWSSPLAEFESKSRIATVQRLESLLCDVSAGKYPQPPRRQR
jgi:hypothetical protein